MNAEPLLFPNGTFLRGLAALCSIVILLTVASISEKQAFGQSTTATLTGTVRDASGSVVPNAAVTLKNESSIDRWKTASNTEGYYSIVAIPAGSYAVTGESAGFQRSEQKGIALNSAGKEHTRAPRGFPPGSRTPFRRR